MKKNYSQKILQSNVNGSKIEKNLSKQKSQMESQTKKKTFSRKPAGSCVPLSKKCIQESIDQVDENFQQGRFSELLEKSKKIRFISCRSQASLSNSVLSNSSSYLSLDQSFNDKNDIEILSSCKFVLEQSIIPETDQQQETQQQLLRTKTKQNTTSSFITRRKNNNDSLIDTAITRSRNGMKLDKASEETKLESSEISELSRTFSKISTNIMSKNIVRNSKNSSKQSLRKSNSSNSLIKRQPQKCDQCELHQRQIRQLISKNQRLERILKNKDDEIIQINKKLEESENKNRQLEKKVKEIQREDFENKYKMVEEQFVLCRQQCNKMREAFTKTSQELKYKNIENTTLKKYQVQCQSFERKIQILVAERNQLRQRLSKPKAPQRSNFLNYPSSLGRHNKGQSGNRVFHSERKMDSCSLSGQQDEQDEFFEEEMQSQNNYGVKTAASGFMKKKAFIKAYDDSSESEIISLSEESNL